MAETPPRQSPRSRGKPRSRSGMTSQSDSHNTAAPYAHDPSRYAQQESQLQQHTNSPRSAGPRTPAKARTTSYQDRNSQQQSMGKQGRTPNTKRSNGSSGHHAYPVPAMDGSSEAFSRNSSTTPAKQAYAGPTFHASPAPSALPMPRLFSKSLPSEAPTSTMKSRMDTEEGQESKEQSDYEEPVSNAQLKREESPLDFFFNAQRAERAGQCNGTPLTDQLRTHQTNTSMPVLHSASNTPEFTRRMTPQRTAQVKNPHSSSKEIFMMEVDGANDANDSDEQVKSVPFKDRISAVQKPSSSQLAYDEEQRQAKTKELKKLLYIQETEQGCDGPHGSERVMHQNGTSFIQNPSAIELPASTPSQVQSNTQKSHTSVKDMEDSLRKMLRLQ